MHIFISVSFLTIYIEDDCIISSFCSINMELSDIKVLVSVRVSSSCSSCFSIDIMGVYSLIHFHWSILYPFHKINFPTLRPRQSAYRHLPNGRESATRPFCQFGSHLYPGILVETIDSFDATSFIVSIGFVCL